MYVNNSIRDYDAYNAYTLGAVVNANDSLTPIKLSSLGFGSTGVKIEVPPYVESVNLKDERHKPTFF